MSNMSSFPEEQFKTVFSFALPTVNKQKISRQKLFLKHMTNCGFIFSIVSPAVHTLLPSVLQHLDSHGIETFIMICLAILKCLLYYFSKSWITYPLCVYLEGNNAVSIRKGWIWCMPSFIAVVQLILSQPMNFSADPRILKCMSSVYVKCRNI